MEALAWTKTARPYPSKVNSGLKPLRAGGDPAFGKHPVNRLGHTEEPRLGIGPGRAVEIAEDGHDPALRGQRRDVEA